MTEKQFKKAIEINKRIEQLKGVLEEFKIEKSCRLSLVYGGYGVAGYWKIHHVREEIIDFVKDKLKDYTKKFIQEIEEEIKELNKEIKNI